MRRFRDYALPLALLILIALTLLTRIEPGGGISFVFVPRRAPLAAPRNPSLPTESRARTKPREWVNGHGARVQYEPRNQFSEPL